MPLPLLAIPIAAGIAGAAGATSRFAGARANANAMMPDAYADRLAELERLRAEDQFGLTNEQRGMYEQQGVVQRGAVTADTHAAQLQRAQAMAGSGAVSGRDLFLADLAAQQTQAGMMQAQSDRIQMADMQASAQMEQEYMELTQREASATAAKRAATANLIGGLAMAGARTGMGVAGANQYAQGTEAMLAAQAGTTAAAQAQRQQQFGLMAMGMQSVYTGQAAPTQPVQAPQAQPVQAPQAQTYEDALGAQPLRAHPYGSAYNYRGMV